MKPPYKIVKSELFKEQEKKLPASFKKNLPKILKDIAKDSYNAPHTMSIFGPSSPEELKQWMGRVRADTIDAVLEYLADKNCLNKKGKKLAHEFWEMYVKEKC